MTSRVFKTVTFNLTDKGLGINIIGNVNDNHSGIFVKSVSPGGLASIDGRLQEGDQIISVNGVAVDDISCDDAVKLLKDASEDGFVQLKICRDYRARQTYKEVCEMYSFSQSGSTFNLPVKEGNSEELKNSGEEVKDLEFAKQSKKFHLDTLFQSLSFLGINLTEEEEAVARTKLDVDDQGNVDYDDFTSLAKELHLGQMRRTNDSHAPQEQGNLVMHRNVKPRSFPSDGPARDPTKNETIAQLEKEISRHRSELHVLREELKNVKSKLKLSEEAQKAARRTEEDYEVVLRQFEEDKFRRNIMNRNSPEPSEGIETMKYRLKKSETSNKLLRTANEKLIDFAMFVADSLKKRKEQINIHETLKKSISSPIYPDFSSSDKIILFEANQTIKAVKTLLDIEGYLSIFSWKLVSDVNWHLFGDHCFFNQLIGVFENVSKSICLQLILLIIYQQKKTPQRIFKQKLQPSF